MNRTISIILLLSVSSIFAQNVSKENFEKEINTLNECIDSLQSEIESEVKSLTDKIKLLQLENIKLTKEIWKLNSLFSSSIVKIDSLQKKTEDNRIEVIKKNKELGLKISTTETNTHQKILEVDQSLSKNTLYGIIGVLSAILFAGLLYLVLSKRQKTDKSNIIGELSKTKLSLEESIIKEFEKQTELMDTQLHIIEKQKPTAGATSDTEPDHSLALKLASEINLIERNINLMDSKTKGLKQIQASVGKLKDNLAANDYEIPELLGNPFDQGMKATVTSTITDENLEKDKEVITKVIKPQVNYKDKMIQTAQIEISVGC